MSDWGAVNRKIDERGKPSHVHFNTHNVREIRLSWPSKEEPTPKPSEKALALAMKCFGGMLDDTEEAVVNLARQFDEAWR